MVLIKVLLHYFNVNFLRYVNLSYECNIKKCDFSEVVLLGF